MNIVDQQNIAVKAAQDNAKQVVSDTLEQIGNINELNQSGRVYDKLEEISDKMSDLIDAISILTLQGIVVNGVATPTVAPEVTPEVAVAPPKKKAGRPKKKDKVFIPDINTSDMEIKLEQNKKTTKKSSQGVLDSLDALNNMD